MTAASAEISTTGGGPAIRAAELDPRHVIRRLPGRNRTKADVTVYRSDHGTFVLKDYGPRGRVIRNTLGRWLVARECRAYTATAGLDGLPRWLGRPRRFALAVEWIDARPLAEFEAGTVEDERFERLSTILDGLHERGVALADLHYRDVLLHADGSVWVIDLAASWVLGKRPGPLRRKLFEHFRKADRFALDRLRARFTGSDPSAAVAAADPAVLAWHRRARRLKWTWDKLRGAERLPPVDDHWRK